MTSQPATRGSTQGWVGPPPQDKPRPGLLAGLVLAVVLVAAGGVTLAAVFGGGDVHPKALPADPRAAQSPSGGDSQPDAAQPGISTYPRPSASPADVRAVRELAREFAAALSSDSAAALTAISCTQPTKEERAAFNTEATASAFTFTLIGQPSINGDVATGKMQGRREVLNYALRKQESGWCASFEWSALLN